MKTLPEAPTIDADAGKPGGQRKCLNVPEAAVVAAAVAAVAAAAVAAAAVPAARRLPVMAGINNLVLVLVQDHLYGVRPQKNGWAGKAGHGPSPHPPGGGGRALP